MERDHSDKLDWSIERRVEGLVNKHMAGIAVDSLQQRLTAVTEEMHSLVQQVSRRSGEELKDESQRGDVRLGLEPQFCSACSSGATNKLIPATETVAQQKIIALLVEIKDEQQRQWAVLRDLQARLQGQPNYEEDDVEAVDMDLPLKTLEQLDEMERQLEEPGTQKKLVE